LKSNEVNHIREAEQLPAYFILRPAVWGRVWRVMTQRAEVLDWVTGANSPCDFHLSTGRIFFLPSRCPARLLH
jgi:hypothetical protein